MVKSERARAATYVARGDLCVSVLDTGEAPEDLSPVGASWLPADELAATLAG